MCFFTGKYSKEYFRKTGELRHITKLKPWPLYDVLTEKYEWNPQTAKGDDFYYYYLFMCLLFASHRIINMLSEFADWLLPMLAFDPTERATAMDCINHPFLADM